ncbi:MAG: cyclic lactone autoinducer peptide [Oscillospiraceae bacterium]
MKSKILAAVSILATLAATLMASSACFWWVYQPEEPKSLQK